MPHFRKSDRVICFVLPDTLSSVWGTSTSSHVTSDKSKIFLKVLAVPGQSQYNNYLLPITPKLSLISSDILNQTHLLLSFT